MGFQQGLSGLNVAAKNLDAVGNNVANASTVGFKSARAEFADAYASAAGAAASTQIGIGATVAAVRQQFTQGNITTTQNPLDVAINGTGFFRLSTNGAISYSRNGQFSLDKDGYIVTNGGARLTGYPADASGKLQPPAAELKMHFNDLRAKPTAKVSLSLNLDAGTAAQTFSSSDPTTYESTAMTIYDREGRRYSLTLYFTRTSPLSSNTWEVRGALDGIPIGGNTWPTLGSTLQFNSSGALTAAVTLTPSLTLTNGAATPQNLNIEFAVGQVTQFAAPFAVNQLQQDGYKPGSLAGFSIGPDGMVLARYTNGQTRAQGQIVLANFVNPQGLAPQGGNQWVETSESGQPVIGAPGTAQLGTLQSGALEESNVDLTEELVKMITAQRIYQANAQTIRTQDQIMQTLVNLR